MALLNYLSSLVHVTQLMHELYIIEDILKKWQKGLRALYNKNKSKGLLEHNLIAHYPIIHFSYGDAFIAIYMSLCIGMFF